MFRTALKNDAPKIFGRTLNPFLCERYDDAPLRYTRAFLRPIWSNTAPVIILALFDFMLMLTLIATVAWDIILYKVYMKGASWSYKDPDFVLWILRPSSWVSLSCIVMLSLRVTMAIRHKDDRVNPFPMIEPKPEAITPRLVLVLWNLTIVVRSAGFLMFIYDMHSGRYNAHHDVAEDVSIITTFTVVLLDVLFRGSPAHLRDTIINAFVLSGVALYLAFLSVLFNVSVYKEYNFRDSSIAHNLGVLYAVFFAVDIFLVCFIKIRNKMFKAFIYSTTTIEEETKSVLVSTELTGVAIT